MKSKRNTLCALAIFMASTFLTGCYTEEDQITVNCSGDLLFYSRIKFYENPPQLQYYIDQTLNSLKNAGFHVDIRWISRVDPLEFLMTGKAKIGSIKNGSGFIDVLSFGDKNYSIRLNSPYSTERKIIFNGVNIYSIDGKAIKEVTNLKQGSFNPESYGDFIVLACLKNKRPLDFLHINEKEELLAKWDIYDATMGKVAAQYSLGGRYVKGNGVEQDYVQAAHWFNEAADQGNIDSQLMLGIMYLNGEGVPQDYVLAYKWLNLAAVSGDKDAVQAREYVSKRMTPAQISLAQELARNWQAHRKQLAPER